MDNSTLLKTEKLKKYYEIRNKNRGKSILRAVDGVSLDIARRETFGLVGESGCGKTTLGRAILRLTEPDGGSIIYDGRDITHINMFPYRSRMQIIFQNPSDCLDPRCRVGDIIAEGVAAKSSKLSKPELRDTVSGLLESVRLTPDYAYRYPHELSGGQQQRVGIARALAVEPEFIVCDEPVSALDVSYQAQIIELLKELQERLGLTYLFISHDLSVVRYMSDRIGVMYLGKLVELGSGEDVVREPAHQYTKALLDAIPAPDPITARAKNRTHTEEYTELGIPDRGCRYCRLCEYAVPECRDEEPELREVSPGHLCACHLL
ncbi:MAG: ATP-binding cassette domain-containing protein [Oscillospiraceae bacterium]|jgi:oligopeptide transport system ATP-binding protein|nr:ATP-binding cassette domain-containing protein [Oscillospiraceae bacterium]